MDAVFEKLGVYELFSIFFAGSVITYSGIVKKCAVIEYPKSEIGIYQAA